MALSYYYEPFLTVGDVHSLFDDFLNSSVSPSGRSARGDNAQGGNGQVVRAFQPKVDIHESAEKNLVTATFELPGLKKEDVHIDVHRNRLVVSGETNFSKDTEENGYVVKERRRGQFSRSVPIPQGTKPEEIKAAMENGVLTVTFPKTSPEQEAKRITIS